ncbi:MAG: hypothetical protein ACTS22_09025 [Phycisphaerales bacterium]
MRLHRHDLRVPAALSVAFGCGSAASQLQVQSYTAFGQYSASAARGSVADAFDTGPLTAPYSIEFTPTVLIDESNDFSAAFSGAMRSEQLARGFRFWGEVISTEPAFPFYQQQHRLSSDIIFSLSERSLVRIEGFIRHDNGLLDTGSIDLLNGTGVLFNLGPFAVEFAAGPSPNDPFVEVFAQAVFPAGTHFIAWDSFSTGIGEPGSALTSLDLSWDISVRVVPAPGGLGVLAAGMVLASQRRRSPTRTRDSI